VILRAAVSAALLLPAAGAPGAEPPPAVAEIAGLLPGSYVSRDPARSARVSVAAVPKNRIAEGGPVFYLEAAKSARPDAPFLQRFLLLQADGARVAVRVYEPRDVAGVRGKWRDPEALTVFTSRDVKERPDCRLTLAKAPAGHWTGTTAAATCFSPAANAALSVTMSLSPQTLEWREEGKDAAGKAVHGPAGEITIYGRERDVAPPAPLAAAAPATTPAPAAALATTGAGEAGREREIPSKVNEQEAPTAVEVVAPSSPSKKYGLADLRRMAGEGGIPLAGLFDRATPNAASVVVVASRSGALSVFSFAEIFSSSLSSAPSLDVSGAAPRLVAGGGRGLEDVISIELRVLSPSPAQ
jgi:hypothetical protein